MRKEGKKYVIKESELKEIIQEMILLEVYNAADYAGMHTSNYNGKVANLGDYANALKGLAQGGFGALKNLFGGGENQTGAGFLGGLFNNDFAKQVDSGKNADAHQVLNVADACNWLKQHAHPKTTHYCARYVRQALNAGGLGVPHGMAAPDARYYQRILPSNGWDEIPVNQAGQPCDVVVIGQHQGHPLGHIAMCLGNGQWASDFIQKTMHGLTTPPPPEVVHVFRYRNKA